MTFSIAAADPVAGDWGVAVASKFVSVGAVVPWARAGVGAVATQSWANTSFGPDGLALLTDGASAEDALGTLVDGDEGRADRQVGMVDAAGRAATFTGSACMEWAGGGREPTLYPRLADKVTRQPLAVAVGAGQVEQDGVGVGQYRAAVINHRHLAEAVQSGEKLRRFMRPLLEVHQHKFTRQPQQGQHQLDPVGVAG